MDKAAATRVCAEEGLVVVAAPIPLGLAGGILQGLAEAMPEGSVLDAALCEACGAAIVCGPKESCERARRNLGIEALTVSTDGAAATEGGKEVASGG